MQSWSWRIGLGAFSRVHKQPKELPTTKPAPFVLGSPLMEVHWKANTLEFNPRIEIVRGKAPSLTYEQFKNKPFWRIKENSSPPVPCSPRTCSVVHCSPSAGIFSICSLAEHIYVSHISKGSNQRLCWTWYDWRYISNHCSKLSHILRRPTWLRNTRDPWTD